MRTLLLGFRLLRHGGRAGAIRAASLAAGVALAVTALMALLSIPGVVDAQQQRSGELLPIFSETTEEARDAPLRVTYDVEGLDGRELTTVAVARTGVSELEQPPWLPVWPDPGEIVVSPALGDLIANGGLAYQRFPQEIIGEIGQHALAAPDTLAAVVGAQLEDFNPRGAGVQGLGRGPDNGDVDVRALRLVISVIVLFTLVPVVVLIATAARLSARTNERRLASLRLLGLAARQTREVLAVETASVALVGALAGAVAWAVLRPLSQRTGAGSLKWWAADINLSTTTVMCTIIAIVALAAVIAVIGANPAVEHPIRTRRNAQAQRPGRWRLALLATGLGLLTCSLVFAGRFTNDNTWFAVFALGNTLTAIGLVASVPAFGRLSAALLDRLGRSPSAMLASRRLRHEPSAIARVIAGMLLIVFAGGFAQGLLVAFDHAYAGAGAEIHPDAGDSPIILTLSSGGEPDLTAINEIPGVDRVVETLGFDFGFVLLATCDTMATLSRAHDPSRCDDDVAQPLDFAFFDRVDGPVPSTPERSMLPDLLAAAGYEGPIGAPMSSEIFLGVARDGSTPGGDIRIAPTLADPRQADTTNALVVLEPTASAQSVAARMKAAEPAARVNGLDDIERLRFADTYRTLVNAAIIFTLTISLAAAAMAATDRAIERRRNSTHLAALGVPGRVQRRAEVLTTLTPLAAGLTIAVAGAAISGSAYLEWGEPGLRIPLVNIGTILATGLICSLVAALIATSATATSPTPDRLRTE